MKIYFDQRLNACPPLEIAAANFSSVNGFIILPRAAVQSRSIGRRKCCLLRDF
jgi:hypothetical protein